MARAGFQRFADGFGRLSALVALAGLVLAGALTLAPGLLGRDTGSGAQGASYRPLRPADPVRISFGGAGAPAPVLASDLPPTRSVRRSPVDAALVSWWSGGARPGDTTGQTVLTAHSTGMKGGLTAIDRLRRGDVVDLLTRQGTMRYRVIRVTSYDERQFDRAAPDLYRQDGGTGGLVLTSAQQWDGVDYQELVVLTGTPLGEPS